MKLIAILELVVLISSTLITASGSPGIDYGLGKSKDGIAMISDENAFHGPHSAMLSVSEKKKYIRLMIYLDDPLPLEEVNEFCMQILPLTGAGDMEIRLFLDVNGDGKYTDKKSAGDNWVKSRANIWDETDLSGSDWMELNAFDRQFEFQDRNGVKIGDLVGCQDYFGPAGVVRIWITLYGIADGGGACLIDYIKLGSYTLSFEPLEDQVTKKGKPKRISYGGKITYTITYGNDLLIPITNLMIVEQFDPRMSLISADPPPDPGTNNVWTIGTLLPGEYGQIVLVMKMAKQNFVADLEGHVSGNGFVSVRRRFTTDRSPQLIVNLVRIICDQFERRGLVETPVRSIVGTTLSFAEHGSGIYEAEEFSSYRSSRMRMERSFDAVRAPATLGLPFDRSLGYNSSWHATHVCIDDKRGSIIREIYQYAEKLNLSGRAEVRSTRLKLASESNFTGMAIYEIESRTKERDAAITTVFEGSYSLKTGSDVYK
ncbi:MAG: conserved exported protein of unknown function [Methanothrix sp.]|jgi:hypothetical protein|nr:MAG: conserved exported protein of unknown function [Methanothrix sp.]